MIERIPLTREEMAELTACQFRAAVRDASPSAADGLDYEPAEVRLEANRRWWRAWHGWLVLAASLVAFPALAAMRSGIDGAVRVGWRMGAFAVVNVLAFGPVFALPRFGMWLSLRIAWRFGRAVRREDLEIDVTEAGVSLSLPGHEFVLPWHLVESVEQTPRLWVIGHAPRGGQEPAAVPLPKRLLDEGQVTRLRLNRGGGPAKVEEAEAHGPEVRCVPTAAEWRAALDAQASTPTGAARLRAMRAAQWAILAFLLVPNAVAIALLAGLVWATGEGVWAFGFISCLLNGFAAWQLHHAGRQTDRRPARYATTLAAAGEPITLWRVGDRLVSAGTAGITTVAAELVRAADAGDVVVLTLPDESVLPLPRRAADAATLDGLLAGVAWIEVRST